MFHNDWREVMERRGLGMNIQHPAHLAWLSKKYKPGLKRLTARHDGWLSATVTDGYGPEKSDGWVG